MRPGIIIKHAQQVGSDSGLVRSDKTGFIGVTPKVRWPKGVVEGDFLEIQIKSYAELASHPLRVFIDPITIRAVKSFYENGGDLATIISLMVENEQSLMVDDPFGTLFHSLLDRLRGEEDIGLLLMPILSYLPVEYEGPGVARVTCQSMMELLLDHCREMNNRFLILDTPRDLHEDALFNWVEAFREKNLGSASYGAIYYPWLMNGDETFGPAGAMAGIFSRSDREHDPFGVRWPPANQVVRGVTHPAVELKWSETEGMAQAGINPILIQPARGVVIWGARTLAKDPKWRYINSRRIISFIIEQLYRDSAWVVFENQRPELWHIITRMVTSRLDSFWEAGLLSGDQAGSEYLVQCDRELNPPEVVDAGQVNVKVLLKPISTAEYIVVDLRFGAGGM